MKRLRAIIYITFICLGISSCVKEQISPISVLEDGEGWLSFSFGADAALELSTKATQNLQTESLIQNFYIFIFESGTDPSANDKVYGHFFDAENIVSEGDFNAATDDSWYISYPNPADGTASGRVKLKASAGSGRTMYMLTNLDSDMVRISSDLLAYTIKTEQDLLDFNVFLNQPIIYRNTHFPMSGKMTDVTISENTLTAQESAMTLERLDAKVRFIFKTGAAQTGQTIESFEARKWRVINVPRTAYVMERNVDHGNVDPSATPVDDYSELAVNFFDTDFVNFEEFTTSGTSEFSFYMLENRQAPKKPAGDYQDRSKQIKDGVGMNTSCTVDYVLDGKPYNRDMRLFDYANDFSTYVLVTGYVTMKLENDDAGQILGGEVQYLIHLGDWGSDINNYKTERNASYTYTVTVNSVQNIRVEVETSMGSGGVTENQPGATGNITIAKEEIALCDAHYASKTLTFHLKNFFDGGIIDEEHSVVDKMTWRVKTPFSEGGPQNIGGIDITEGLDYQWVRFRLNKQDAEGSYYIDKRRKYKPDAFESSTTWRKASDNKEGDGADGLAGYHNDGSMDIVGLVDYMRKQVKLHLQNPEVSDFDSDSDPKICVTVFVDEYYYTEHPLTHSTADPTLWKHFVNADDRVMQILCNSDASKDLESRATGSVVTIQQKSIQSIFNTNPEYDALQTAWGLEQTDEHPDIWEYGSTTGNNTDNFNGLLNSCKEWSLTSGDNFATTDTQWSKYVSFEEDNDTPILKKNPTNYQYLRYSCLTRNRDNNGDGEIDRSEIRWYTASIQQLIGLYVGEGVISPEARLYNRTPSQMASKEEDEWRQHVVSSTSMTSWGQKYPIIVWAEEGISTGANNYKPGNTIRCVRNLGILDGYYADGEPETYPIANVPQDYITKEQDSDGGWILSCTHINESSLRYYTSRELPVADQNSEENKLYKKFKIAPEVSGSDQTTRNFKAYNQFVDAEIEAGRQNPYCPGGYRTPNQRELAMMLYYLTRTELPFGGWIHSRTYWSFGSYLNTTHQFYKENKTGFNYDNGDGVISLDDNTGNYMRCVRDVRTD